MEVSQVGAPQNFVLPHPRIWPVSSPRSETKPHAGTPAFRLDSLASKQNQGVAVGMIRPNESCLLGGSQLFAVGR